jgi:hypothetical protein
MRQSRCSLEQHLEWSLAVLNLYQPERKAHFWALVLAPEQGLFLAVEKARLLAALRAH